MSSKIVNDAVTSAMLSLDVWALMYPEFQAKRPPTKPPFVNGSTWAHNTRVQNVQDISPRRGMEIRGLVRKSCTLWVFALVIGYSFNVSSTFDVKL